MSNNVGYHLGKTGERVNELLSQQFIVPTLSSAPTSTTLRCRDALVQYKGPIDKMQAVINNYLLDPEDAYAIGEFNKMQAWCKEAKEIAKEALLYELH